MPKTTQTPKPEVDATLQPYGGIPVAEQGVAEVDISDGDDQAVVVDTAEEPKARNKKKGAKPPAGATPATQNAPAAKSKKGSKRGKATNTAPRQAATVAKTPVPKKPLPKGKNLPADTTLAQLAEAYIHQLESVGKSHGTLAGYANELKLARAELGDEARVRDLTEKQVRAFFLSDRVNLKRSGQRKAEVGIAKTRRILRLALTWAQEVGLIENAPIPNLKAEGAAATKATPKKTPAKATSKAKAKKTAKK